MRYLLLLILAGTLSCDADETESPIVDPLAGVYNVETVTCNGVDEPIGVVATVTLDEGSYLEEWDFDNSDCQLALAGTAVVSDDQLTLEDVGITCTGTCPPNICDSECSVDQVYQYTKNGGELLLSFTQRGDEFGCGPCGDGVPSTYLLVDKTP